MATHLSKQQINDLLRQIENPKDRKTVQTFFRELKRNTNSHPMQAGSKFKNLSAAQKALEIISKIGVEFGKHVAIDKILHAEQISDIFK